MSNARNRQNPWVFLAKGLSLALVVAIGVNMLFGRFKILIDIQQVQCVPYRFFILDTADKDIQRGELFAFRATKLEPFHPVDVMAVKVAAGVAGDRVQVTDAGEVYANGELRGLLNELSRAGRPIKQFVRDEHVPDGKIWAMGTAPESYDSRYWGYVDQDLVYGRVYGIF